MSYLIDTDRVACYLNGRPDAIEVLSTLRHEGLAISLIAYGEIYDGIYSSTDPRGNEGTFQQFPRRVEVIPLPRTIMKRFARLRGQLRRQGRLIPDADLLIASTALTHDLTLVTRNLRHFQRIPGLLIYTEA